MKHMKEMSDLSLSVHLFQHIVHFVFLFLNETFLWLSFGKQ